MGTSRFEGWSFPTTSKKQAKSEAQEVILLLPIAKQRAHNPRF
jgi:hypothetical protein